MKPINEERVLSVVDRFDSNDLTTGHSIYVTINDLTKKLNHAEVLDGFYTLDGIEYLREII